MGAAAPAPTVARSAPTTVLPFALGSVAQVGFTEFDTAPWYGIGASERALGKVLPAQSGKVKVATKVGHIGFGMERTKPAHEHHAELWVSKAVM